MANWGLINSGPTFQTLVNTLLLFEDPANRVFGRPGRDGGLDARSAAGDKIWQAKFHQRPSLSKSLADAKSELEKIKKYRQQADPRYPLWKDAKDWTMATNLALNPNDRKEWDHEIVPLFQAEGLAADIWGVEMLEKLLVTHSDVEKSFFAGENRCFASLAEAREFLDREGPRENGLDFPIIGRDADLAQLEAFFHGPKHLICVHGVGGVGKSRLLHEFGCRIAEAGSHQVFWGNVETMAQSSAWLTAIRPEKPTLLLLDEPTNPGLIARLAEQMRTALGRMNQWKIVIAMRSPKDPVLAAYHELPSNIRDDAYPLSPPSAPAAEQIALGLIDSGPLVVQSHEMKALTAGHIAKITGGIPVWIALAVKVLETTGSLQELPGSVAEIARRYLNEVIENQSERVATKAQIEALLHWLALYRQINAQDAELMAFLTRRARFASETELRRALASLVKRRFVVNRGVEKRLFEIKPDVMAEFIVTDWLREQVGGAFQSSADAAEVIGLIVEGADGKPVPRINDVIETLAAIEFKSRLQDENLDLLQPVVEALLLAAESGSVTTQRVVVELLGSFAFARLGDVIEIIRMLRAHPQPPVEVDTLFGKRMVTHDDVVESLPWALFEASQYARTQEERQAVLGEMARLLQEEKEMTELPQTGGKRPKDLLPRLISGGQNFASSYAADGFVMAKELLTAIPAGGPAAADQLDLAQALIPSFIQVERERVDFSGGSSFTVHTWLIPLDGEENRRRTELRNLLHDLTRSPDPQIRKFAWNLLEKSHASANRARLQNAALFRDDIRDELLWVRDRSAQPGVSLSELKEARPIWDWHFQFEEDPELKAIAAACEAPYLQSDAAQEFDVFFDFTKYAEAGVKAKQVGSDLGGKSAAEIMAFLQRAGAFAGEDAHWGTFLNITETMAPKWDENPELARFVAEALQLPATNPFTFAVSLLDSRLKLLRDAALKDRITQDLEAAFVALPTKTAQAQFLFLLYSRPHPLRSGLLSKADFDFVAQHLAVIEQNQWPNTYRILGGLFYVDWPAFKNQVEMLWKTTPDAQKGTSFFQLFDAIHFMALFDRTHPIGLRAEHFHWLLDLFVTLPDLDSIRGHAESNLEQMRNGLGRRPITWLVETLQKRIALHEADQAQGGTKGVKLISRNVRLSAFTEPVRADTAAAPEVVTSIESLLALTGRRGELGYYLPTYLAEVDPEGYLVPDRVVAEIRRLNPTDVLSLSRWAHYAGAYPVNSVPWRKIAAESTQGAQALPSKERTQIYLLFQNNFQSSQFLVGEMNPQPGIERDRCRQELQDEADVRLKPYREWNLAKAEAFYTHTVEQFKEEQGQ